MKTHILEKNKYLHVPICFLFHVFVPFCQTYVSLEKMGAISGNLENKKWKYFMETSKNLDQ